MRVSVPRQKYRPVISSMDRQAAWTARVISKSSWLSGTPSRDLSSSTVQYSVESIVTTVHVPSCTSEAVPVPVHA